MTKFETKLRAIADAHERTIIKVGRIADCTNVLYTRKGPHRVLVAILEGDTRKQLALFEDIVTGRLVTYSEASTV